MSNLGKQYKRRDRKLYSDKDEMRFAVRLEQLLYENDISNRTLSQATLIDEHSLSRMLHELQYPNMFQIIDIAKYFSVSTDYLLCLKEDE